MQHTTPRQLRKRWMLSQGELAELLGLDQASISRLENGETQPVLATVLGFQVIFGCTTRSLVPALYDAVEDAVMRRGAELERRVANKTDYGSIKKRQLLEAMMHRATKRPSA